MSGFSDLREQERSYSSPEVTDDDSDYIEDSRDSIVSRSKRDAANDSSIMNDSEDLEGVIEDSICDLSSLSIKSNDVQAGETPILANKFKKSSVPLGDDSRSRTDLKIFKASPKPVDSKNISSTQRNSFVDNDDVDKFENLNLKNAASSTKLSFTLNTSASSPVKIKKTKKKIGVIDSDSDDGYNLDNLKENVMTPSKLNSIQPDGSSRSLSLKSIKEDLSNASLRNNSIKKNTRLSPSLINTSKSSLSPVKNVKIKKKIGVIDSDSEDDCSIKNTEENSVTSSKLKSQKVDTSSQLHSQKSSKHYNDKRSEQDFKVPKKLSPLLADKDKSYMSPVNLVKKNKKVGRIESDSEDDNSHPNFEKESMRTPRRVSQEIDFSSSDESDSKDDNSHPNFQKESMITPRRVRQEIDSSSSDESDDIEALSDDEVRDPKRVKSKTPKKYTPPKPFNAKISSGSSSVIINEDENDVIELSSEDESQNDKKPLNKTVVKQTTLDSLINKFREQNKKTPPIETDTKTERNENENVVSPEVYQKQCDKVRQLEGDFFKAKNLLRTLNIDLLPDRGELLRQRHANLEITLKMEKKTLEKMVINKHAAGNKKDNIVSWEEIQAGASAVMPKTHGKKGISTYNAQKAMTLDRLEQLHGSLKTCPTENKETSDPKGLKVELMSHQRRALAWMIWREEQNPSGGILAKVRQNLQVDWMKMPPDADVSCEDGSTLNQNIKADDMGLGKTLTLISLMLKMKENDVISVEETENSSRSDYKCPGGTLVVCPASLLNQWSGELESKAQRGLASYELYHGPKREVKPKRLAKYDMVITTYSIIMNECEREGAVFRVRWRRIILDEAHQIRNHKSQTAQAVFKLSGQSRWALTGTPVHNKELDMYSLLCFLRCSPFDDLPVWKRWVGDKSTGGQERLHTVISSLLLRRTKAELMENGTLQCLPERKWELISVTLEKDEMDVYSKVLLFSKTLFAQYLHQHAERNQMKVDFNIGSANDPNSEYFKMRKKLLKFNNAREIKQHEILVLLLRLRQICCHPSLIISMLQGDEDLGTEEDPDDIEEVNLLEQLNKMNLGESRHEDIASEVNQDEVGLKEACRSIFNRTNPIFSDKTKTSKIKIALNVLKTKVLTKGDKAIVVSQWTSLLKIVALHLEREGIKFDQLDGTVPVSKRMEIVDNFNQPNYKTKILLLSLTAGGVGLNLVGANHLLLLDLHWNPQLENQAQDRIYRMGQKKPVFVYKLMVLGTIEERIKNLQEKKLEIAESMLTGTKQVISSKLSLHDLKMLFDM